jgi:hypothetical protein
MSSSQEFAILNFESSAVVNKHYKKPADTKAFFAELASTAVGLAGASMVMAGLYNANAGAVSSFGMQAPGLGTPESHLGKASNQLGAAESILDIGTMIPSGRINAFKQTLDFAYYLSSEKKEKDEMIVLVKVNKDSGAEAEKLVFDDPRPVYQVDEYTKRVYYLSKGMLKVFNM